MIVGGLVHAHAPVQLFEFHAAPKLAAGSRRRPPYAVAMNEMALLAGARREASVSDGMADALHLPVVRWLARPMVGPLRRPEPPNVGSP